jgi:hypothetical protein
MRSRGQGKLALFIAIVLAPVGEVRADEAVPPGGAPPKPPSVALEPSYRLPQESGLEVSHMPAVLFTGDGRRLITGTSGGELIVWDTAKREVIERVKFARSPVMAVVVDPAGKVLVALLENGTLEVVDPATGKVIAAEEKVAAAKTLAVSPDGTRLAIARGKAIELRLLPGLEPAKTLADAHPGEITNLAVSPDGKHLASVCTSGELRLFTLPDLDRSPTGAVAGAPLYAVAFSPDGARIAFGGHACTVDEVEVATGRQKRIAAGQPYWITAAGYSPDGKVLAIGDESCDIWLFDAASAKCLFHGKHHEECWLSTVAWAPDGETFLFGCRPNSHAGKPAVFAPNTYSEALADAEVRGLAATRAETEVECWDAWARADSQETRAIRDRVRASLAKTLELEGKKPDEKTLDDLERRWLTGGPVPVADVDTSQTLAAGIDPDPVLGELVPGKGITASAPAFEDALDFFYKQRGTALASRDRGILSGEQRKEHEVIAAHLTELKKRAEALAPVAGGLAKVNESRARYDETLEARMKELRGKFILNQWRLKK